MLYFDPKTSQYFITEVKERCDNCNKIIKDVVSLNVSWSKKSFINFFCGLCSTETKIVSIGKVTSIILAVIVKKQPEDSFPIALKPPQLKGSSDISLFDVDKLDSDETIDNTVFANRLPSIKGAKIGADITDPKMLDTQEDVDKHFDMIAGATPVIPKRLEKK